VAETVEQIIAQIVADDQISQTLRGARRKIKKFGDDVDKLNKTLTKNEKEALAAAHAEKKLAAATRKAALAAKMQADELKTTSDALKKGAEQLGISGETMANAWTAAAVVVVGSAVKMMGAIKDLAVDAVRTYTQQVPEATAASERLSQAYKNLQVTTVDAALGQGELTKAIDKNAVRVGVLDEAMADNNSTMSKAAGFAGDWALGMFRVIPIVGQLPDIVTAAQRSFDSLADTEERVADQTALLDHLKALEEHYNAVADAARDADKEVNRALRDAERTFEQAKRESKAAARAFKRLREEKEKLGEKEMADILNPANWKKAADGARVLHDVIRDINAEIQTGAFGMGEFAKRLAPEVEQTGFAGAFDPGGGGLAGRAETGFGPPEELGIGAGISSEVPEMNQELQNSIDLTNGLNEAFMGLATGGVAMATDAFGEYIKQVIHGSFESDKFGQALAAQLGALMQQVGSGMIAMATAAMLVESGAIFSNPFAGIAAGAALVAAGATLEGFATKGSRASFKKGSAGKAREAAEEVTDVVTSRLGAGNRDQRERQGDIIKVFIGEQPIRDITTRSVKDAIFNREIPTLSPAGAAL
jgi:hypothetical protein